jgi:hypothetical protein
VGLAFSAGGLVAGVFDRIEPHVHGDMSVLVNQEDNGTLAEVLDRDVAGSLKRQPYKGWMIMEMLLEEMKRPRSNMI